MGRFQPIRNEPLRHCFVTSLFLHRLEFTGIFLPSEEQGYDATRLNPKSVSW
jgi:hypothetical protein